MSIRTRVLCDRSRGPAFCPGSPTVAWDLSHGTSDCLVDSTLRHVGRWRRRDYAGLPWGSCEAVVWYRRTSDVAAITPATYGSIFATQGERVLHIGPGEVTDVTQGFGGPALSDGRVVRGACGEIYVRGCPKFRRLNRTYGDLSTDDEGALPHPMAADLCGNIWSLLAADSHTRVLAWPANTREATTPGIWQDVAVTAGLWEFLLTDAAGFVWIAGPQCACRLHRVMQRLLD
jgi:hypothetical protein